MYIYIIYECVYFLKYNLLRLYIKSQIKKKSRRVLNLLLFIFKILLLFQSDNIYFFNVFYFIKEYIFFRKIQKYKTSRTLKILL